MPPRACLALVTAVALASACTPPTPGVDAHVARPSDDVVPSLDTGPDAADVPGRDASFEDLVPSHDAPLTASDAGSCAALPPAPDAPIRPQRGELFYAQLGLGGLSTGESALVVGPDGTSVLLDVANDAHTDALVRAVQDWTGAAAVDHVVVTHFHADHGDGITNLLRRVAVRRTIVHRGLTDMSAAANEGTLASVCRAAAAPPGRAVELCVAAGAADCDPARWGTPRPATGCPGLATADLALGAGAALDFVAANGWLGAESFARAVHPIAMTDSNGENARSIVAVLRHGAFRMLVAGDLTGGGSDTDAVEAFYAPRIALGDEDARGVDVLHAGHHGRDTSSSAAWVDRFLPRDGRARNAVMGISAAHLRSPHAATLRALLDGARLGAGRAWTTRVAAGGATASDLVDAGGGAILLGTLEGGAAYVLQALGTDGRPLASRVFRSVRACR